MTAFQKLIKYGAMAFAAFLIFSIFSGIGKVIVGVAVISDYRDSKTSVGEMVRYSLTEDITDLEIDVAAATLKITVGEDYGLETNFSELEIRENGGKLTVKEREQNLFNVRNNGVVHITLPADAGLGEVELDTGVSLVSIERLSCKELKLDLGVGNTVIDYLSVRDEGRINCGVGALTVKDGRINDMKVEHGVGKAEITAMFTGKSRIEAGLGQLNINLSGGKELYSVDAETGIGNLRIDGKKLSDEGGISGGENELFVEGGIGNVNINFK